MRLIFFACSKKACDKMQETKERWLAENPEDEIICVVKCKALGELSEKKSLSECTGEWFQRADGLVYFCAVGIAVRSIAPYLVHKSKDPAVVVFDETCRYGISLLSGHLGGANELTERLCSLNGAEPVITTASDREGKIAIDVFAAENGLYITDYSAAKDLEAALLAGEKIGFLEEGAAISLKGKLTEEFVCGEEASACRAGVLVSPFRYEKKPFPLTLQLVPKCVTVGIGCKRGMTKEQIKQAVQSSGDFFQGNLSGCQYRFEKGGAGDSGILRGRRAALSDLFCPDPAGAEGRIYTFCFCVQGDRSGQCL